MVLNLNTTAKIYIITEIQLLLLVNTTFKYWIKEISPTLIEIKTFKLEKILQWITVSSKSISNINWSQ